MKIFDKILENYVLPYQFKEEIREENLLFFSEKISKFLITKYNYVIIDIE